MRTFSNTKIPLKGKDNDMMINLDELNIEYRNEMVDSEAYGVYVQLECFILIRELIKACEELQAEVYELRGMVNGFTPSDEDIPYPEPACDMPGGSCFINQLIRTLYKAIFDEDTGYY
jgi:hypothetical protein